MISPTLGASLSILSTVAIVSSLSSSPSILFPLTSVFSSVNTSSEYSSYEFSPTFTFI